MTPLMSPGEGGPHTLKGAVPVLMQSGFLACLFSFVPIINLLNFLLLFWMIWAGWRTVSRLSRRNGLLSLSEGVVLGLLSGCVGGGLTGLLAWWNFSRLTVEQSHEMEKLLSALTGQGPEWVALMMDRLPAMAITLTLLSMMAGALGGGLCRTWLQRRGLGSTGEEPDQDREGEDDERS